MKVGVFAMDPGRTTGIAYTSQGIFLRGSSQEILSDKFTPREIGCYNPTVHESLCEVTGCNHIADLYLEVSERWRRRYHIPTDRHYFVYEDFVLRGQVGSTNRAGISPRAIIVGVATALTGVATTWVPQTPEQAKTRWTNERLRAAGLWTPSMVHARDATRHLALWVTKHAT